MKTIQLRRFDYLRSSCTTSTSPSSTAKPQGTDMSVIDALRELPVKLGVRRSRWISST